jgi:hypothetical protein
MTLEKLAGPVSLSSYLSQQQGPGPLNLKRLIQRLPGEAEDMANSNTPKRLKGDLAKKRKY